MKTVALARGVRERLPNRRRCTNQKAIVGGGNVYVRTAAFADGRPAEVFIRTHREGAAFRTVVDQFAVALSIGLQYGVPLAIFLKAFRGVRFEPYGAVKGDDRIATCTSMLDYVMQELAASYPKDAS